METKHTKEYAEKVYDKMDKSDRLYIKGIFIAGYMEAIKQTAAPELLEALNLCIAIFEDNGYRGVYNEEKNTIINAIKKATE